MSSRGSVTVDSRTNTLLIQDTAAKLDAVRSALIYLDKPVRQVMIEARIVIASTDFERNLGIKWGGGTAYARGIHNFPQVVVQSTLGDLNPTGNAQTNQNCENH